MQVRPKVRILEHTPNPERLISIGAKLCYSNSNIDDLEESLTEENVDKFITMLSNLGHESPLEHVSFTFAVEGVSRAFSHQLVRHRIASYSQQSQRYVKENQFEFIIPEGIREDEILSNLYIDKMERDQKIYDSFVMVLRNRYINEYSDLKDSEGREKRIINEAEKYAIENARYVLPNACETKLIFTMNVRTLYNFLALRTCNRAQTEIREVAELMYWELVKVSPKLFYGKVAKCISENKCPEGKMSCGKPRYDLVDSPEIMEVSK